MLFFNDTYMKNTFNNLFIDVEEIRRSQTGLSYMNFQLLITVYARWITKLILFSQ